MASPDGLRGTLELLASDPSASDNERALARRLLSGMDAPSRPVHDEVFMSPLDFSGGPSERLSKARALRSLAEHMGCALVCDGDGVWHAAGTPSRTADLSALVSLAERHMDDATSKAFYVSCASGPSSGVPERSSASVREALLAQGASIVAHVQPKVSARAVRRAEAMRDTLGVDGTTEL